MNIYEDKYLREKVNRIIARPQFKSPFGRNPTFGSNAILISWNITVHISQLWFGLWAGIIHG